MELTRRDALAVLAGAGIVGGDTAAVGSRLLAEADGDGQSDSDLPSRERVLETLVDAARVVYPSEVTGVREFVETFSETRLASRPDHRERTRVAVAALDDVATAWYGARFADLGRKARESVLREVGADTAKEDPDGTLAERVRYSIVNEVLYGLYASPKGGTLVGIENPQGYPGGTTSYQRGPR